jgi:hypothetical protein
VQVTIVEFLHLRTSTSRDIDKWIGSVMPLLHERTCGRATEEKQ